MVFHLVFVSEMDLRWRGLFIFCVQEPRGAGERAGGAAGRPGGLPGLGAARARLLHRHLGLSVLPGHRQLPILPAEGEYSSFRRRPAWIKTLNVQLLLSGLFPLVTG